MPRGKIPDLDGDLAGHLALDVPLQGVVAARRERGIDQIDLVLLVEDAELDRGRVDERIGPGELDAVDAFLDGQQAVLADHGDVFGVVDRKLRALAGGQGHQVDGGLDRRATRASKSRKGQNMRLSMTDSLRRSYSLSYFRAGRIATGPWNRRLAARNGSYHMTLLSNISSYTLPQLRHSTIFSTPVENTNSVVW